MIGRGWAGQEMLARLADGLGVTQYPGQGTLFTLSWDGAWDWLERATHVILRNAGRKRSEG